MKKKINITYLMFNLYIILLYYITKNHNNLAFVCSFYLGMLIYNIFSNIDITYILEKYRNKFKVYKIIIGFITLLFTLLSIISYYAGNIIPIENLGIINLLSIIFFLTIIIMKITGALLKNINYKKIGNKLFDIYLVFIIIISSSSSLFLYKVFNLNDNIRIILLYLINIIAFIVAFLLLYILILRKSKMVVKEKYNYKEIFKHSIEGNKTLTLYNIINESYIYTSIIIIFYILTNKYNYSYENINIIITNIYFYGIFLIKYIKYLLKKHLELDSDKFSIQIVKKSGCIISICILLMVISGPICKIIFNTNNFLFDLILLLFFYTLYDYTMHTSIKFNNNKINKVSLLIGLIIKLVFEIPLINTSYRIGNSLAFGSIISIIMGMIISTIISMIFINKKLKINILDKFSDILNIIYENIILCLILVLFTLIVNVDTEGIVSSILVIIFYVFITLLFYFVKRLLKKKE